MTSWFDVDREGLRQIVAGRGPEFIVYELLQNCFDEKGVRSVWLKVAPLDGDDTYYQLSVEDDSPDGFRSMRDAYTLFAPSYKKADPSKRGRFNLGEKFVVAMSRGAVITSTKGSVIFAIDGTRHDSELRRESGTLFVAEFAFTDEDVRKLRAALGRVIPPHAVTVRWFVTPRGGEQVSGRLQPRNPVRMVDESLPTVIADDAGILRPTTRITRVEFYSAPGGAWIFEGGIPVVPLPGDKYHINVLQKVPLNADRDNVTPGYLRTLRVLALNACYQLLDEADARESWVTAASEDSRAMPKAVETVIGHRFGEKRVTFDPSDPESNMRAASEGYTVIPGGALTRGQWENVRRDCLSEPAGRVLPSPKAETAADGIPARAPATPKEVALVAYCKDFCERLLAPAVRTVRVKLYESRGLSFGAAWGDCELLLNLASMGRAWSAFPGDCEPLVDLLIHEAAHQFSSNHLDAKYHAALSRLGARAAALAGSDAVLMGFQLPELGGAGG